MGINYRFYNISEDGYNDKGSAEGTDMALRVIRADCPDIITADSAERESIFGLLKELKKKGYSPVIVYINNGNASENTEKENFLSGNIGDGNKKVREILQYIKGNYTKDISAERASDELYVSASYLMHLLKRHTGRTFNEFLKETRINAAKSLFAEQKYRVYEVCGLVGYKDVKYFSQVFKKVTGMTPSEYSKWV